ncbi:hypothetical protein EWM62_05770 [Mucilaginibacter terrigena]|uniref:Uncharacterized protein n=1 Tax=Mucilaginibacter terrigena TaxID=2492395 RepID=A0A4Q5LPW1_9SPHI|nr:DUF6786 family protein [Mucilaginibacter terrigena]RYU91447.1 hypothetical protein EWM62_05770 [Mucilaginibacter terrigena]
MKQLKNLLFALPVVVICSCQQNAKKEQANTVDTSASAAKGTFGYDLAFLQKHDSVIVLKSSDGKAQIIVSPKYQAKVFTSTANGQSGRSFGWVNYKTFDAKPDEHMNAFGGEDRLWLGPEGGKFSLYFKPGTKMEFANWHTPPAIDNESWQLVSKSSDEVTMSKTTEMLNYANTLLKIKLDRIVKLFHRDDIQKMLGINAEYNVAAVGFTTTNIITNNGDKGWDKTTGAPCLWNLDMFSPSEKTVIVVPYHDNATGKVATTDYFGQIPPDRVKYDKGILLFKADGKSRGKLGVPPNRAKTMAGSYDPQNKVLTITLYDVDSKGTYLNQEWTPDKPPFIGDAVNAYNDGPLATGGQMGPFYEIESVSPAAFLKPGEKLVHAHSVFHFTGDEAQLNDIAVKTLGISLKDIQAAFK